MGMSAGGGGSVKADPNVTPMIDVMLVLLIIFMITIPQINAGFTAVPPEGQNLKPHPEEDGDQVLGIDDQGQYYLNKKPVRNEDLETLVREIYGVEGRDDYIMYVKAHKDLQYLKVIDAMDKLSRNGVRVAALITEQAPGTESLVESDRLRPGGN
ncbi:MAG: ExbD/TolR family protein [Gemmatimonas sp.]|jgi:biopolymer transport protein TolR|uniref:ExbD/TolR family protein n=2 Tax=Gemmatimonas sp. TaxID=1962908 RepID=UPI0022BAE22C|nr:biopolymer transporter ExbD [Gemmatimonas sp.]MCA2984468.1 biopolymer transporter ExbD [Gemmatimonas sp.]MCA2987920.1 biopolymer transporter ExbD [Gemmatimonas sp.]MCE2954087.1 biopolymer transporter ExbD [Gemmatimonas sp.]MCZ8268613.1 biopolymer transporter ExbD [Gemmatimonas sp.]